MLAVQKIGIENIFLYRLNNRFLSLVKCFTNGDTMKKILFLVLVSFVILSGCTTAPVTTIKHNVEKNYSKDVSKLQILSSLGYKQKEFDEYLRKSMSQEAKVKGIEITYASVTGVEESGSFLKQALEVNATHSLIIKPDGGTVNFFEEILSANYDLNLIDLQSMARIWRASIKFNPFMRSNFFDTSKKNTPIWDQRSSGPLAKKIFDTLQSDGLLPSLN